MKTLLAALFAFLLFIDVELEKRELLDNKIEMLLPKDFQPMSAELINIKYPGKNRPKLILTNEASTTNIGFSLLEYPADSTTIETYKDGIKASYVKAFPTATWLKEGITTINGKKVGYIKFLSDALDQRIYNYLFLTDVEGKLLLGTFNCVEKDKAQWEGIADKMVSSLKVN